MAGTSSPTDAAGLTNLALQMPGRVHSLMQHADDGYLLIIDAINNHVTARSSLAVARNRR